MPLTLTSLSSSEDVDDGAGSAEEEGEGKGQGEEDVLLRGVGVEALVVGDKQNGGDNDTTQKDAGHPQRVKGAHLADDSVGVEEQEAELVHREHGRDSKVREEYVEDGAGVERSPNLG